MFFSKPKPEPGLFTWSETDHGLGLPIFDVEHKHLFAMMAKVHASFQSKPDRYVATQIMEEIIQAVRAHFDHEERVMRDNAFPGVEAHALEHGILITEAQDLLRNFKAGSISLLALPVFLRNWFIPHINDFDRTYAGHLRRNGFRGK